MHPWSTLRTRLKRLEESSRSTISVSFTFLRARAVAGLIREAECGSPTDEPNQTDRGGAGWPNLRACGGGSEGPHAEPGIGACREAPGRLPPRMAKIECDLVAHRMMSASSSKSSGPE